MKQEDKDKIKHEIESEGIVYTFTDLGDWKHIKDEKFHKLRSAFVKSFESFLDYLASIGAYPMDEEEYEAEDEEDFEEDEDIGVWVNGVWTKNAIIGGLTKDVIDETPAQIKKRELENLKTSYDWRCAFNQAYDGRYGGSNSQHIQNVVEIIAYDEGENDGRDWIGIFKLKDKTYIKLFAGCDYTGWDCQAGGGYEVYKTLKEVCSKTTLTEGEQARLRDQLVAKKIKLDWGI